MSWSINGKATVLRTAKQKMAKINKEERKETIGWKLAFNSCWEWMFLPSFIRWQEREREKKQNNRLLLSINFTPQRSDEWKKNCEDWKEIKSSDGGG